MSEQRVRVVGHPVDQRTGHVLRVAIHRSHICVHYVCVEFATDVHTRIAALVAILSAER